MTENRMGTLWAKFGLAAILSLILSSSKASAQTRIPANFYHTQKDFTQRNGYRYRAKHTEPVECREYSASRIKIDTTPPADEMTVFTVDEGRHPLHSTVGGVSVRGYSPIGLVWHWISRPVRKIFRH